MEQVNNLELKDEAVFPDDAVLQKALAESFGAYRQLLGLFEKHGLKHEWRNYRNAEGILGLPISAEARESIRNGKNVGKSKPCTFEIQDETVLHDLETVLIHKMTVK